MLNPCSFTHPETTTFNPVKHARAERRDSGLDRERERRTRRIAAKTARDPREKPLPPPCRSCDDGYDPRDDEYASLERHATELARLREAATADELFVRFYSSESISRVQDAARRFIRKAAKHPIAPGTVLGFEYDAWLVIGASTDGDGIESWRLLHLAPAFVAKNHPRTVAALDAEFDLSGIEACPATVACLDMSLDVRKDFVSDCAAFARVGRVPRAILEKIRAAMDAYNAGERPSSLGWVYGDHAYTLLAGAIRASR